MRGDGGAVSERGQIPRERTNDGDERRRRQSPTTTPSTGASRTDVRGANERSYDPVGRLPAPGAKRRGLRARRARSSPRTSVECQSPAQRDRRERMRRGSSGITRLGNASPRPQVSDARRVLRRFPPACCRTSDETPRNSATEESEVRRMDDDRAERASLGAPNRPRVRPLCGARYLTKRERTTRAQRPKSFVFVKRPTRVKYEAPPRSGATGLASERSGGESVSVGATGERAPERPEKAPASEGAAPASERSGGESASVVATGERATQRPEKA